MKKKPRVILRRCEEYDADRIRGIIREGMQELGAGPRGRILIKPNVVTANKGYIHHSYTAPLVVESMIDVLRERDSDARITIGESGGIGIPTRLFFHDSGYFKLARRTGVPVVDFNEQQCVEVELNRAKHHKTMLVAKALHEAEYKIWMPKLKYHIVTQITNALKLNIGILTHKERFLFHDDRLNDKVVDMLELGYPDLIVTDAITCGRGFESSPLPFHLGAMIISDHPLACDAVAARVLSWDPEKVLHLVEARERGYGSLDLDDIEVSGDVTIDELAETTRDIYSPFQDLQKLDSPVRFYEGKNRNSRQLCYGGCICSVKGVLGTADAKYPGTVKAAKKGAMVMGLYEGDVIHPGEPVAIIGDCAGVTGKLEAGKIIRVKGCPVMVKSLMFGVLFRFGIKSPAWDFWNLVKLVFYTAVKGIMRVTRPFRRRARLEKGVRP